MIKVTYRGGQIGRPVLFGMMEMEPVWKNIFQKNKKILDVLYILGYTQVY